MSLTTPQSFLDRLPGPINLPDSDDGTAEVTRPLVAERVFHALIELMISGSYKPGDKLPPQRKLASELDVTVTALREGLKRLEQMGLIEVRHGDAMRVRDWRQYGGLDVVPHLLFRPDGVDLRVLWDIFDMRSCLLSELAGLAASRRSDEHIERMRSTVERIAETTDRERLRELDFAFVAELASAAESTVFSMVLNSVRPIYQQHSALLAVTSQAADLLVTYRELVEAITAGESERASSAARALSESQRESVQRTIEAFIGSVGNDNEIGKDG